MATLVSFNGTSYSVPAYGDTGWAQGTGNLSSYLIAIAANAITPNPSTPFQITNFTTAQETTYLAGTPAKGAIWFNTTTSLFMGYDGSGPIALGGL